MMDVEDENQEGSEADISSEASGSGDGSTSDAPAATSADESRAGAPAHRRRPKAKKKPLGRPMTPEERNAERLEERRKKAIARRTERAAARTEHKMQEHEHQATAPRERRSGVQKTRQGVVVSDKAEKTITVRIDVARRHRRYAKVVRTSTTVHAHDESNDAHIGDTVVVREARPLSRTKRWRLVEVVARAK
ncbi:MAG: 30S ribosomal protein S17 [Solirubrobacteraceae bacterium]